MTEDAALQCDQRLRTLLHATLRGLAEVGTGAEHAVGGPDQDDAHVGVLLGEVESVEELGHQLAGERVAVVR